MRMEALEEDLLRYPHTIRLTDDLNLSDIQIRR